MNETIAKARRELRQLAAPTPEISIYIGQCWERALDIDPEGSQLKYVVEEARELCNIQSQRV